MWLRRTDLSLRGMLTVLALLVLLSGAALCQEEQREVPIIKQINRVNDDGTYTFGYEAADGSFKIETRDVLGNVKGMFGYVDERGELKRVSYTANNGTGFQASANIGRDSGHDTVTRRPVLVYRGLGSRSTTIQPRSDREQDLPTTTAGYSQYVEAVRRGYVRAPLEEPTTARPLRVLVTRRPVTEEPQARNPNLIRRQLDRAREDYARDSARRFRYQQQDAREVYRNQLLEQNNLKPDYPTRSRYYQQSAAPAPQVEEYEEEAHQAVQASIQPSSPVVERQVPPRYRHPIPPQIYQDPYLQSDRRYPGAGFRRPLYDSYDYETFREAMNYLIQYLQYMRRADPYGPYPPPYDYLGGRERAPLPPPVYQPRAPVPAPYPQVGPYQQPYSPVAPYPSGPVAPPYPGGLGGVPFGGGPAPYPSAPAPLPGAGYLGGPFAQANLPYINPNVQYSSAENAQETVQEQLSTLKSRMDSSDQSDSADTRPPSSGLIRMLLARPSTQRPAIRSVQILGTSHSSTTPATVVRATQTRSTTTTTEQPDLMEASS